MDCAEVFFKLVEIPIAFTAAGATVAAVFFARRAYMAQAKQLRDLEEDRMFAGLTSAPRFIAETTPQVWDQRFPEPTLLIPKLYTKPWSGPSIDRPPGKKDPVWFKIRNIREGVTLRKIHVVQEDGRPSPIEFYWVGHDTYLVSYSEDLAARSEQFMAGGIPHSATLTVPADVRAVKVVVYEYAADLLGSVVLAAR